MRYIYPIYLSPKIRIYILLYNVNGKFRFIKTKLRIFGDMLSYLSWLEPAALPEDYSFLCTPGGMMPDFYC